jgi:hypothetical protein
MGKRSYSKSSVIQYISSRTVSGKIKDFRRMALTSYIPYAFGEVERIIKA